MIKLFLFLLQSLLLISTCSCQTHVSSRVWVNEYIGKQGSPLKYCTIEYKNIAKVDAVVWLDFGDKKCEREYFSKQNGDYILSNLIYENLLTSNNMVLGSSFLKVLRPGENFRFHFNLNENKDIETYTNQIKNAITSRLLKEVLKEYKFNSKTFPSYIGYDVFISF